MSSSAFSLYVGLLVTRPMETSTMNKWGTWYARQPSSVTVYSPSSLYTLLGEVGAWSLLQKCICLYLLVAYASVWNQFIFILLSSNWSLWRFFLLIFSGTGSGVGTRVLEILQNEYPDVYRYSVMLSGVGPSSFEVLKAHAKNNLEYWALCLSTPYHTFQLLLTQFKLKKHERLLVALSGATWRQFTEYECHPFYYKKSRPTLERPCKHRNELSGFKHKH